MRRILIRGVLDENAAAACVTCSFQTECMALVDLVIERQPAIPVLFLETGYHFPETYAYRDQMTEQMHLNLVNLSAKMSVAEQESQFGILNQTAPDSCCGIRKVEPAVPRPGRLWRLVHSAASRAVANARELADRGSVQAAHRTSVAKSEPSRRLDQRRRVGLFEAPRHPGTAALRPGLHQHRLRALHHAPG